MKKYLPVILLAIGLLVLGGVFFFVRGRGDSEGEEVTVEEVAPDVPLEQRPVTSLTPSDDGHWLTLVVEKIVIDAKTMDYELLYKLPDGRTQGVPGTIKLEGQDSLERELLLGSESSGKFRYDEGVEQGTLTLRFRNEKGKLVAKFSTEFHLQSDTDQLTSVDGNFSYAFDKEPSSGYFITMETFGVLGDIPGDVKTGPYGVFSSLSIKQPGEVNLSGKLYMWDGKGWVEVADKESLDISIFIGVGE